ncbi:MAG: hypothetical protein U5R31_16780 [Acidimicrobiia bacterium]|nr:hypothetical protein [Acidimicrobiia bacterium]
MFPVTIDPSYWDTDTASGGGLDTWVGSNTSSSQSGSVDLHAGLEGGETYRSLLQFDLPNGAPFDNVAVIDSYLDIHTTYSDSCTAAPLEVRGLGESWDAKTGVGPTSPPPTGRGRCRRRALRTALRLELSRRPGAAGHRRSGAALVGWHPGKPWAAAARRGRGRHERVQAVQLRGDQRGTRVAHHLQPTATRAAAHRA